MYHEQVGVEIPGTLYGQVVHPWPVVRHLCDRLHLVIEDILSHDVIDPCVVLRKLGFTLDMAKFGVVPSPKGFSSWHLWST